MQNRNLNTAPEPQTPSLRDRLDEAYPPRLSADDAEALLEIDAIVAEPSPEWIEFIGEAVSTWLVEQRAPAGIVDEAKAHWLLARIDAGGRLISPAALALLRRCCVKAPQVPLALLRYLRKQESSLRLAVA